MNLPQSDPRIQDTRRPARTRITARQWALGFLFLGTVAFFAVALFLGFSLAFGLLFNDYTINPLFFIVGWFVFRHGLAEYRNRLAVSGTATATANSAAIGLVELSGRADAEHPTESPVTKTTCAFWRVEVRHRGEKDFRWIDWTWTRVMERTSAALESLVLEDDTGRLRVWCRGAEMIPTRQVWRSDRGDAPDDVKRFVAALGLEWSSRSSARPLKVVEERIEQGGPLYVLGTLAERRQIPEANSGWLS